MKILITVPDLSKPGGVSSLYNILAINKEPEIDYFVIHGLNYAGTITRLVDLLLVYFRFIVKLPAYNIVHINPSLNQKSFLRDAVFIFLAKIFGKKVVVYWHGWSDNFEIKIHKNKLLHCIFFCTYAQARLSIVLGSSFAQKLKALGLKKKIVIESNAASDSFITEPVTKNILNTRKVNLLFIARIEREKGIYIAADTVAILSTKYSVRLVVAGSGSEENNVKEYIRSKNIKGIEFVGHVSGEYKHELLNNSDLLILPTYHNEGMPISIIEGMLYGLPIVTRPVGGIPDWLKNGQNGILTNSLDANDFAEAVEKIINDNYLYMEISKSNSEKAKNFFIPAAVTTRLKSYYSKLA